jgi:starch phosphorylase
MKLAINGAVTIGTLDGANVEIRDHVGPENIVIFGLTAEEVGDLRSRSIGPHSVIEDSPFLSEALEAIASGVFSPDDRDRYRDLVNGVRDHDWFMLARDFGSYAIAQRKVDELWSDPATWYSMAINNTARVGWFSSDRTIRQYAEEIWGIPVA